MSEPTRLSSFDELMRAVDALPASARATGAWTLPQVLSHCAQSITFSVSGFPSLRSGLFRATVGRIAARAFLRRGYLEHDLAAPIPGAPAPRSDLSLDAAKQELRDAIRAFREHSGPLAPHFAYGAVPRADYEKLHAMHAADHLGAL